MMLNKNKSNRDNVADAIRRLMEQEMNNIM